MGIGSEEIAACTAIEYGILALSSLYIVVEATQVVGIQCL